MIQALTNWYYKRFPQEMVSWWKTKEAVQAKVTTDKDGSYIMWMEGEKYPFPGYPRGHLIVNSADAFSPYSVLKHTIKTKLFNENWFKIEKGESVDMSASEAIFAIAQSLRHDMLPADKCAPAVREMYKNFSHPMWRDILTCIFQEDDAYRWRFQWIFQFIKKEDPIGSFNYAMHMLENAEVIDDMKERINLIRTVLLELWKDPKRAKYWIEFVKNANLKKLQLTKADKYYFRAKYFKVDYPHNQY